MRGDRRAFDANRKVHLIWDELIQTAARHFVLSSMHDYIQELSAPHEVPVEITNVLSTVNDLNRERNEKIFANVREIATALNQAGIELVLLKGAAQILAGIYPSLGTRFLSDVDMLVAISNFPCAIETLRALGYFCQDETSIESFIGHSYAPMWRPDSAEVDLHRAVGLGICRSILPASDVLRDSTVYELDGVNVRIPSPEHLVVHQILHSQIHERYRERIWPNLRAMYDIVLLQRHFGNVIDWRAIEGHFRKFGQYPVLAMYLLHLRDALGFECPVKVQLTTLTKVRWWRRRLLRAIPWLRLVDPWYILRASVVPRMPISEILHLPGGWKYLTARLFSKRFYADFIDDLSS